MYIILDDPKLQFHIGTAYDLKSQKSDPENQCGLDDLLDIPKNIINEHETNYKFVSTSAIHITLSHKFFYGNFLFFEIHLFEIY